MLVFPSNPNTGDVFAPGLGLPTWMWDGGKWTRTTAATHFTLETLSDVSISDPAQGQALMWSATEDKWINAVPQQSITTLAGLLDVAIAAPSAGALLTYDGTRWVSGGNALITGVGTAQMALTVTGVTGQQTSNFLVPAGANGVGIGGPGTSPSNWQFNVGNGNDILFRINADGSGWLGPNSVANLSWNTVGSFTVSAPNNGPALNLGGAPALGWFPSGNIAAMQMQSSGLWAFDNGLGNIQMEMGTNYYQSNLGEYNYAKSATGAVLYRQIVGGGHYFHVAQSGTAGSSIAFSTAMQISMNGNVTINPPPPGHTALQVLGGFSPTSIASFQAIGGVNGPGLYINMQDSPSKVSLIASGYNIPGSFAIAFANGEVLNFGGGTVATFSAPYVQVPNMASTGVTGLPYVVIDGNGNLLRWGATSSLRYKTNIHSVAREQARAVLSKLRAITYTSTIEGDDPERVSYGLIAEEVAKADPRLVYYKEGKPESVIYERVTMLLIPLLQELLGLDEPTGEFSDVSFSAKS